MGDLIDDRTVDALRIVWEQSPGYTGPRVVDAPAEVRVIRDLLSCETWQHFVQFILPGVLHHHGRVIEYSGFRFQSDLAPDDDPFEEVELFDPIETLHISEGAFDRLMGHYFEVILQGVTLYQRPETHEEWWQGIGVKLASMFVTALSVPELGWGAAWAPEVDGSRIVVVDANVGRAINIWRMNRGPKTYAVLARWLIAASDQIDLSRMRSTLPRRSPRFVQQAVYLFRSRSNRTALGDACAAKPCNRCPSRVCPFHAREPLSHPALAR